MHVVLTCRASAQNNSTNRLVNRFLLRSWHLYRLKSPHHPTRVTQGVIRKGAVAALLVVRVRINDLHISLISILLADSPLPPEGRMPNGVTGPGSTGRPSSRGGTNWPSGPAGSAQSALTKPPPGRDPKSRARSRDYLKQFVLKHINLRTNSNIALITAGAS